MSSSVPCAPSNMIDSSVRASPRASNSDTSAHPRAHAAPRRGPGPRAPACASIVDSAMSRLRAATLSPRLRPSACRVGQVADPDAAPRDLVLVGGADPARRRADLALAAARLAQQIEIAVVRQDEVRLVAHDQAVADVDPRGGKLVDLREERLRIHDDAVADHADDAVVQDARRQQPQDELACRSRRRCAPRCVRPGSARRSRTWA